MKNFFAIALISLMAISAFTLTSCNKDEDKNVPEVQEETKSLEFKVKATANAETDWGKVRDAIAKVIQKNIGDRGEVSSQQNITISYGISKETEVKKILKLMDPTDFDTAIKQYPAIISLAFTIVDGEETLMDYSYSLSTQSLSGTWAATIGGISYQLTLTNTKAAEEGRYVGSFKMGDKDYPGSYKYVPEVNGYGFESDEKAKNDKYHGAITAYIFPEGENMQITVISGEDSSHLLYETTFTKVKQ